MKIAGFYRATLFVVVDVGLATKQESGRLSQPDCSALVKREPESRWGGRIKAGWENMNDRVECLIPSRCH
jgi:hypothetical protein